MTCRQTRYSIEHQTVAFYAPTQALRRGVQEVWAVWTEGLPLVQSAMRGHALGAVSKLQ